jgi:hypothetical protein
MSGILTQTVGQCKMQIWRHPENSNQTTDVFTFHLLKLGSAFAQLLSRSSIITVGTSSKSFTATLQLFHSSVVHKIGTVGSGQNVLPMDLLVLDTVYSHHS